MGQKVNPHGLRVGVIKDWDSRWFVKKNQIGDTIVALLGKYATEKVLASGGIDAPESEYLMATPQPVKSTAQSENRRMRVFFIS